MAQNNTNAKDIEEEGETGLWEEQMISEVCEGVRLALLTDLYHSQQQNQ